MNIQTTQNDLFPETLLVSRDGARIYTTSLKIAQHFGKQHAHVLRTIRKIISVSSEDVSLSNFGERDFIDGRGKKRPFYDLTHDGFAIAVMSFTGPEALEWKWKFLEAFRQMEAELRAALHREASALYTLRPHWREIGEGTAAGLDRAAICRITGHKSPNTITANRRRMRNAGLLI